MVASWARFDLPELGYPVKLDALCEDGQTRVARASGNGRVGKDGGIKATVQVRVKGEGIEDKVRTVCVTGYVVECIVFGRFEFVANRAGKNWQVVQG